jgi:DNA mismatch repair protein MutS
MSDSDHDIAYEYTVSEKNPLAAPYGFRSILFPPGMEQSRRDQAEQPAYFVDFNLDQIVATIVAKRDEEVLGPLFYSPYQSEEIVRYRQGVFSDLERPGVLALFPTFCDAMRTVRANLTYARKISSKRHEQMVVLHAVSNYCDAIVSLLRGLQSAQLSSVGLMNLRAYVTKYTASEDFAQLTEGHTHPAPHLIRYHVQHAVS